MANFNFIAPIYDSLKQLIFKDQLDKAASCFIDKIPPASTILIIGGGSGKLLPCLSSDHMVSYVDASEKMIALAKKKNFKAEVVFLTTDIINFHPNKLYDVIITPFFLDCFTEKDLAVVFSHINSLLKKNGLWLHSDFYPQNKSQRLMVRFMYFCFRMSTGLKVNNIPDFDKLFKSHLFFQEKKAVFSKAMVHSYIYKKID
jgi:2-polyprenyl-3-methyl-5-hydroxy-6-metoxy-1,4-benzoquinol methylase